MIDLKKIQDILQRNTRLPGESLPKHIIINTYDVDSPLDRTPEAQSKYLSAMKDIIAAQPELTVPILTLNLGPASNLPKEELFLDFLDYLPEQVLHAARVKVSFIGKWYSLRGDIVTAMKRLVNETKDYDNFFLNFLVNYDPREEISDACRVIILKIVNSGESKDSISADLIKGNLSTSYFIPPDLVIEPGKRFSGSMLFDSAQAFLYQAGKPFHLFAIADINRAIEYYGRAQKPQKEAAQQ